jgi:hypothetical protein
MAYAIGYRLSPPLGAPNQARPDLAAHPLVGQRHAPRQTRTYSMAWDPHETTDLAADGQYVYELEFMKQLLEQLKFDTRGAEE